MVDQKPHPRRTVRYIKQIMKKDKKIKGTHKCQAGKPFLIWGARARVARVALSNHGYLSRASTSDGTFFF